MTLARAAGAHHRTPGPLSSLTGSIGGGQAARGIGRTARCAVGVWLVALVILIANSRGQIFFDTKLGVDIDPAGFYPRLWHLWNPQEWFGTLQDQYIGYAFPMAPFYLAGELLRVPVWLTERLWLSLLMAVGFAGVVKLAEAVRIGTDRSRIVAGLAFALWPTFTIVIGSTSAGVLPGLLVPWAVLPLANAARSGSLPRAAARSGVAVLFMGGVNATSTLDVLLLPALFIATQLSGRRRAALAALWAGAVALATAWWLVPLLLQAKYSFDFLPYVEQSATTTGTMSAAAFLRGAGNWTAYLNLGQPWLRAGWVMVAFPVAILASALASATGLLGLARRDLPGGSWLRLSLGLAALVALAGYPGPLGGPFHQPVEALLNGAAAPLRNVYKVEPVAAVVLALGVAHALVLRTRRPALAADPAPRALWHLITAPVIGLVLLGLAYPQVSGQVLNAGSFRSVPRYWRQAAGYLGQHSPRAPALVVPAESHGTFLWGEPVDDPLEPLASSPWVAQGLVPYGGAGSALLLRSLESAVTSGQRVAGLAGTLRRSGIRYVLVRNDLNSAELDYVPPQVVHQALLSSGFRRVAAFGPLITGAQTDPGAPQIQYALPSYRAVEIFAAGPETARPPSAAVALPVSRTVLVSGGPDALLQLTGQHVLAASAPAVLAGDRLPARPALWAVTDSNRRADHVFGLIDATGSYTYTATEKNPPDDPLGGAGGPPRQLLPVAGTGRQTVAVVTGAASVTASSSGSWLAERPQIDPVNVFDGNPSTVWTEADPAAVGQWVQITFDHPVVLPDSVGVTLLDDVPSRLVPSRLTVRTDTGTVTSAVRRTRAAQPLLVPPGRTRTLRVTIAGVTGEAQAGQGAGLAGVSIPGITVARYLKAPRDSAGERAGRVAFSFDGPVPSPASLGNVAAYPPLARIFATWRPGAYRLRATAMAVPGPALDAVLSGLTPAHRDSLEVTASSTWGSLPSLAPVNLFRAHHRGPWIAGAAKPVIRLTWQGNRTIRRMVIRPPPGFA
ncbi:MAG TPA: alpha-(1-_3)-arabinofuranosyltransferase family protein, partial [Streptosporangiaceae bacterium]|nr:alpha-(1->3)-arabinofuranosyltransferase family protein [Streptosporangiaceae bacterium]